MRTIGMYLIFVAVVSRAIVVLFDEPEFPRIIVSLAIYGLLLLGETWLVRQKPIPSLQSRQVQLAYLFSQSILVIGVLILSSYEDFLGMLFVPISLEAVSFFGRRIGYTLIGIFSLAMSVTLLFSDVGPLFGLGMGILYSGVCFLFGGYAYQVQKANAARDQNELIFGQLQTAHRQLQGYAEQIASLAVEQERNRLAHELHDSVTQTVFSMNLAAQSAQLVLDKQPARTAGQLIRIEELAASAQREIQSLVSQLKPRSIAETDLPTALYRLALEHKIRDGLQVSLEIQGEGTLSETVATGLYSIAHEAFVNVSKHSRQCEAILRLNLSKDQPSLEIEDHGQGFDPAATMDQRGHLGLAGMAERAREIGWRLSVISKHGKGTRILVTANSSREQEWNR